jgi:glycerophosphoryl diester phosphodiesterase
LKRKVNAWTVNRKEDLVELMNCGIDGIITDDPKTAVSLKEQLNSSVL